AQELVVSAPLGLERERFEQLAPDAVPARAPRHVDRVLADAGIHAPVAVLARTRPPDHLAVLFGDEQRRRALADPAEDVLGAGREGLTVSGYLEHYRIGPVEDPDYTKWETELALLVD